MDRHSSIDLAEYYATLAQRFDRAAQLYDATYGPPDASGHGSALMGWLRQRHPTSSASGYRRGAPSSISAAAPGRKPDVRPGGIQRARHRRQSGNGAPGADEASWQHPSRDQLPNVGGGPARSARRAGAVPGSVCQPGHAQHRAGPRRHSPASSCTFGAGRAVFRHRHEPPLRLRDGLELAAPATAPVARPACGVARDTRRIGRRDGVGALLQPARIC